MIDWNQAYIILKPLTLFVVGMVLYAVFTFNFYRFVARRELFKLDLDQYNTTSNPGLKRFLGFIFYIIKYIVIFPIFAGFWILVLTVLLAYLSTEQTLLQIFYVAVAVVTSVRITAYYKEDLSKDLAKMLPFALLGVFLINISYFSLDASLVLLQNWPALISVAPYYVTFVIAIELLLRIYHGIAGKSAVDELENQ